MSLKDLAFKYWDATGTVIDLIKKWEPGACNTEKDYEESLCKYLHENLKDIQVTKQYANGRFKADIVVGDNVIIEIKYNLKTTGQYQRLSGQLQSYKSWKGNTILLLTGTTEPNLKKQVIKDIADNFTDQFGGTFGGADKVVLIEK